MNLHLDLCCPTIQAASYGYVVQILSKPPHHNLRNTDQTRATSPTPSQCSPVLTQSPTHPTAFPSETPEEWLSFADIKQCLFFCRTRYLFEIQQGLGNEALEAYEYDLKTTVFSIAPLAAQGPFGLTWNEAPAIANAFLLKMGMEGYRKRLARIYVTEWGQTVGTALVQPYDLDGGKHKESVGRVVRWMIGEIWGVVLWLILDCLIIRQPEKGKAESQSWGPWRYWLLFYLETRLSLQSVIVLILRFSGVDWTFGANVTPFFALAPNYQTASAVELGLALASKEDDGR